MCNTRRPGPMVLLLALAPLAPACGSSTLKTGRDAGADTKAEAGGLSPDTAEVPPDLLAASDPVPLPDLASGDVLRPFDLSPEAPDGPAERRDVARDDVHTADVAFDSPLKDAAAERSRFDVPGAEVRWVDAGPPPVEYTLPTPDCRPEYITAGPDGNLWFTEGCNRIGRSTLAGKVTEFPLATAESYPTQIVAGPDGNLWFIESGGCRVGRITTGGDITEFAVPTAGCFLQDLVVGPDGNLWFTEIMENKIGRMTLDGKVTEFRVTPETLMPTRITVGPDRNLWYTSSGLALGRVTISGTITSVPLPFPAGAEVMADCIVSGPDGNLWLGMSHSDTEAGSLLRLSLDGTWAEFPLLHSDTVPQEIIVGPDGNLWFGLGDSGIVRFSTQGELTMVSTAETYSLPQGITVGPDGNIWFTSFNTNQIGRINL